MAKRKRELVPEIEAKVVELLSSLRQASTLPEYHRALVTIGADNEAAREAQFRLAPPFRSFGGPPPGEDDRAISWSPTHLLVVEDDLVDARLVARRGVSPSPSPGPTRDASEDEPDGRLVTSPDAPPGADPDAVVVALKESFAAAHVKVGRITAERQPGGGGRVTIAPGEGPKKTFVLGPDDWSEPPAAIARGIVEAIGGQD